MEILSATGTIADWVTAQFLFALFRNLYKGWITYLSSSYDPRLSAVTSLAVSSGIFIMCPGVKNIMIYTEVWNKVVSVDSIISSIGS